MDFPDLQPKVVLGIAAHPDDLDFSAAGTLAKFARDGAEVHYLILTDGSKGSADRSIDALELVKTRQAEQQAALEAAGGKTVQFLAYTDGALEVTMELKKDIVQAIRTVKPDVVVTIDPTFVYSTDHTFLPINHPDHRAAGQAALDAVFPLARDHLAFPELSEQGLEPHKVATVLLTNFDKNNYCVDISDTIEQKLAAISAHTSQISDIAATCERMKKQAAAFGKTAGCAYAECFVRLDIPA